MSKFTSIITAAFLGIVLIAGSVYSDPTSDLSSPSQEARDAAAQILRKTYTPPSRQKWDAIIATIKHGDPLSKVTDAIQPYQPVPAPQAFDGWGASQDSYWLDGLWILRCEYTDPGKTVISVRLVEQLRSVYVKPPAGFTGLWTTYYLNGQPQSSIEFKDGRYHGTLTSFWPDGSKSYVQHYDETGCNGEDTGYFRSGNIQYLGHYKAGKQVGIWTWYNEDGSVRTMQGHQQTDTSSSSSPAPLKNQKPDPVLKQLNDEPETLQAIPTLPHAPDFKTTRSSVLSKYIHLYLRAHDAANELGKQMPSPASTNVIISKVEISGISPTDVMDPKTRKEYDQATERNIKITRNNDMETLESKVSAAMAVYCAAAFDLFDENEAMNSIVRQEVTDPGLRKYLEDRLDWLRTDKK